LIATMIATAAIGIFIERVFYRRLTRSGGGYTVAGMGMIIVGFGMAIILQNLAFLTWGATSFGYDPIYGPAVELGGITLPRSYLWIAVVAITLMTILNLFLQRTKLGLAVRAVAANKEIASLMGINVPLMISVIFGVACALGAAGGVLIGPINFVSVEMGYLMLIKAFSAAVIGGFGSLPGAILGGLLLGVAETFGAAYISGSHKDIYAFILLIVVLMIRPSGLMGVIVKVKA
jgi:branched-chain amino acid transport system permease protein